VSTLRDVAPVVAAGAAGAAKVTPVPQLASHMHVRTADVAAAPFYFALAAIAQREIRNRGLSQYVPGAHARHAAAIIERFRKGAFRELEIDGESAAFVYLQRTPTPWWRNDDGRNAYLGGLTVAPEFRGMGVGRALVAWCKAEALRWGCASLRLDCHADNARLCAYYRAQGFRVRGLVEQMPGYRACLLECPLSVAPAGDPAGPRSARVELAIIGGTSDVTV
jgi:ribosomal protein S18 acetylase RimI-like enzyme